MKRRRPIEARKVAHRRLISPLAMTAPERPEELHGGPKGHEPGGHPGEHQRATATVGEAAIPTGALRIMMVDDDIRIRTLTRMLLERSEAARIVAEAEDGDQVLDLVRTTDPDVVLLDLLMPRVDGREVLPQLVREAPNTMVLVLTALSGIDEADQTFALGAFAYLEKSIVGPDLPEQIRELHGLFQRAIGGETVWSPMGPPRVRR
jgi:CheY-like chemotaxis protein